MYYRYIMCIRLRWCHACDFHGGWRGWMESNYRMRALLGEHPKVKKSVLLLRPRSPQLLAIRSARASGTALADRMVRTSPLSDTVWSHGLVHISWHTLVRMLPWRSYSLLRCMNGNQPCIIVQHNIPSVVGGEGWAPHAFLWHSRNLPAILKSKSVSLSFNPYSLSDKAVSQAEQPFAARSSTWQTVKLHQLRISFWRLF